MNAVRGTSDQTRRASNVLDRSRSNVFFCSYLSSHLSAFSFGSYFPSFSKTLYTFYVLITFNYLPRSNFRTLLFSFLSLCYYYPPNFWTYEQLSPSPSLSELLAQRFYSRCYVPTFCWSHRRKKKQRLLKCSAEQFHWISILNSNKYPILYYYRYYYNTYNR